MPQSSHRLFATAPRGIASLLRDEVLALGADGAKEQPAGVAFGGDLQLAYRACLWSRTANRVLLAVAEFPAPDPEALYAGIRRVDWSAHLEPSGSLAVDFNTTHSAITHSHFGALKVKDAVVDQFRDASGTRPSVDTARPDLRINVHLHRDRASVAIDLSGDSLHRRGYRQRGVAAPLKENLAAAILLRAGWPQIASNGGSLLDPMCGSGTLPIEAALIAADIAPGQSRDHYGFLGWRGHQPALWETLLAEAEERRRRGLAQMPRILGYDTDPEAIEAARANLTAAGLAEVVEIERRELAALDALPGPAGLVVVNPPYGERLGDTDRLATLYAELGRRLRDQFSGWKAAVFTGNPELAKNMGLRARRLHPMYNGAIPCKLLRFEVEPQWFVDTRPGRSLKAAAAPGPGGEMLANRLTKNLKHLGRWARREGIDCYRLYDADIPEYALAVDLYRGEQLWVHVQEYAPPRSVDAEQAKGRLREALGVIPGVLDVPPEQVFFKRRQRQKGREQYEKLGQRAEFMEVTESGLHLLVNFTDYLDTGLFLDHRPTRDLIRRLAGGGRFLNLFAYTGTASVYAAAGGAASTTSVDLSRTYLDWARRNLALNGFEGPDHALIQADCLDWLEQQSRRPTRRYNLIFLDPPTFSTSKRMRGTLDIQRDHAELIRTAMALLEPGGVLLFSNNFRRFKLDREALAGLAIEDIGAATIPKDFARSPRIHNCWRITHGDSA